MSIKQSVLNLISVETSRQAVDSFCREEFRKRYGSIRLLGSWKAYKGFELINDKKIRINYRYGGADMEFDDYFTVKIPQ